MDSSGFGLFSSATPGEMDRISKKPNKHPEITVFTVDMPTPSMILLPNETPLSG
jgi:hypothetical protein